MVNWVFMPRAPRSNVGEGVIQPGDTHSLDRQYQAFVNATGFEFVFQRFLGFRCSLAQEEPIVAHTQATPHRRLLAVQASPQANSLIDFGHLGLLAIHFVHDAGPLEVV
jgi:hypothetical protein